MSRAAFHPSEFIQEEMNARGWSRDRLALAMGGDFALTRTALEFYLEVGPTNRGMRIGEDMAMQFAVAFGTSVELWQNLERTWLEAKP